MNRRGQMGFVGEDLIALMVVILALSALLAYLNALLGGYVSMDAGVEEAETAWFFAERQAREWAYRDEINISHIRALDPGRICLEIPESEEYDLSFSVRDLRENLTLCEIGRAEGKVAGLPVVIFYSQTKKSPGILEAKAARK